MARGGRVLGVDVEVFLERMGIALTFDGLCDVLAAVTYSTAGVSRKEAALEPPPMFRFFIFLGLRPLPSF